MSDTNPSPFGDGEIFSQLSQFFGSLSKGADNQWDLATQIARQVATGGEPEDNVDPLDRVRLEELMRVADLHVSSNTGMSVSSTGRTVSVEAVTRSEWASRTLEAWRPILDRLATSMSTAQIGDALGLPGDELSDLSPGLGQIFGQLMGAMGPALVGMQLGSAIGHLSTLALGQYELPIPRPTSDRILLVPANIDEFARDWSLPVDDLRLWVCLREVAYHAVIGLPHVRERLESLYEGFAGGFEINSAALGEHLANVDLSHVEELSDLQEILGDPSALLGEMMTPSQQEASADLEAIVAAIEGWVDHVMDQVGISFISSYGPLTEALRRRRVEKDENERFIEKMFGLEMSQSHFDRAESFIDGIVERSGEEALLKLWAGPQLLPTPAEIDAPGLWLERITML